VRDLFRKVTVDVRGEILEPRNTINQGGPAQVLRLGSNAVARNDTLKMLAKGQSVREERSTIAEQAESFDYIQDFGARQE
jgi:hypothetical protein